MKPFSLNLDGFNLFSNFHEIENHLSDCMASSNTVIVCFTRNFVSSMAVLPHSPGVVYHHLLLRRETRIPRVAPSSFQIGIWDLSP